MRSMSTLHQAIIRRNPRQVRLLTNVGCNVNRADSRMRTPMRLVCDLNNEPLGVSLGSLLLRHGAGIHHKDQFGISVFCYACIKQRTKLVEVIIQEREIHWLDKDIEGNTALHHAAASGNYLITRMVIEQMRKYGLDIDQRNNARETPLILAERFGHLDCAELLRDSGKASTAARDDQVFKNAEEWRRTWTVREPRKLSTYFSAKFPDVAKQLTLTVHIKEPPSHQEKTSHDKIKPDNPPFHTRKSTTTSALPKLLELQREQQLDTFRASAKPLPDTYRTADELRDWSEDEMNRLRADEVPWKRKTGSFPVVPLLAQQRFRSMRKQNQNAQISLVSKESYESSTSKKQPRRKDSSELTSATENLCEADRVRKTSSLKAVSESEAT
ncbi:uncharacterized protein LOC144650439 [Oculina patagonica]